MRLRCGSYFLNFFCIVFNLLVVSYIT
jgi:hypothetical protein